MTSNNENSMFRKIGTTMYEISVKQSENAKESVEDILARLIVNDSEFYEEVDDE